MGHKYVELNDSSQIEKKYIYNFVKKLLGVGQHTQTNFVYGELLRTSLNIGRVINVL